MSFTKSRVASPMQRSRSRERGEIMQVLARSMLAAEGAGNQRSALQGRIVSRLLAVLEQRP